jgi:SAM-dependent methyltransferase
MAFDSAYRDDLAYIHDAGHGQIAGDAAALLLDELTRSGHRDGLVVDLGCGSGVLAGRLCDAGYRVLGVDLSESMIALARVRAPAGEFRVGSFVSADLPPCVAVTAIGEVLNYGFDAANDAAARAGLFARAFGALAPGGLLLFDVAGPARAPRDGLQRTFSQGANWAALVECECDPGTLTLTRHITSFRQVGALYRRDSETHRMTLIDAAECLAAVRGAGFEARTLSTYGALPLPAGVSVFLCRKPTARSKIEI